MTERLVIPDREEVDREISVSQRWWTFSTRFNVAPSQSVPVARVHEKQSEGVMMRWGLVPSSRKGSAAEPAYPRIAADSIESSEELRSAWLQGQRCIVPLAGFYIW